MVSTPETDVANWKPFSYSLSLKMNWFKTNRQADSKLPNFVVQQKSVCPDLFNCAEWSRFPLFLTTQN